MNQSIICNLNSGKLGRSTIYSAKPAFYLGQSHLVNLYFEDLLDGGYTSAAPDAYSGGIQNVDKDASSLVVKIGRRGQPPILTQSSWTNLPTTVAITQSFSGHKSVFEFKPTPIRGYYTVTLTGSATFPASTDYPTGAAKPSLPAYSHTIFRDAGTTAKLHAEASESELEDAIKALFREIISGVASQYLIAGDSINGVPNTSSGVTGNNEWAGYTLRPGQVSPSIVASTTSTGEWNLHCYVPDIELELVRIFYKKAYGTSGDPSLGGTVGQTDQEWAHVVATTKGAIDLSNIVINDISLKGPNGKTGSLALTDAAFSTALGSANETDLWMECLLDSKTVAEGAILLKRPIP